MLKEENKSIDSRNFMLSKTTIDIIKNLILPKLNINDFNENTLCDILEQIDFEVSILVTKKEEENLEIDLSLLDKLNKATNELVALSNNFNCDVSMLKNLLFNCET